MHSRLFEISKTPVAEENRRGESYYETVDTIMCNVDYVSESYRDDDIAWLKENLPEEYFSVEGDVIHILKSPKPLVRETVQKIQELAENLTTDSLIDKWDDDLYFLKKALTQNGNFFGFVFDMEDEQFSQDNFYARLCRPDMEGVTELYIGGTVDFHV